MLPNFSDELTTLLTAAGEQVLAAQVSGLSIVDRCRCGDDFCGTFYTELKPQGSYGAGHKNLVLEPVRGDVILDVVNGTIVCVEVLYRDEIRNALIDHMP